VRVLVCGGRNYDDFECVRRTLDELLAGDADPVVIHGAARGADSLAGRWAIEHNVHVEACPADWNRHGRAAGPIRNQQMLDHKPDVVLAFPGGSGTKDMITRARRAGVPVLEAHLK
jgi:hypothetical protein